MSLEILQNPRDKTLEVFDEDFDQVAAYFSEILNQGTWSALPGGVIETFVPSSSAYLPLTMNAEDFRGYRMDTGSYIRSSKIPISEALSLVEGRSIEDSDCTLCPSVSFGLLVTLIALKRMGVRTLLAELPTYFAGVEQALTLGFAVSLWPTLPEENYRILPDDLRRVRSSIQGPVALLITQPRYGMGFNRSIEEVGTLRECLNADDVIVVDEAADQTVPAPLGALPLNGEVQVVRVRGLVKGLGLNAAKVAVILHPRKARSQFGEIVDFAGGALDAASLTLVSRLCQNPPRYAALLEAAQQYVRNQRAILADLMLGLPVRISPIESGYIGTAHISFRGGRDGFTKDRERFLSTCRTLRMPVVLGSSMYFPYRLTGEIIRINYFTSEDNIRASASVLTKVLQAM